MSGSVGYLTLLSGSTKVAGDPVLNAIYGLGGSSTSTADPVATLTDAQHNQTRGVKTAAAEPQVQLAVSNFTKAVNSATSVKQLLANPQVMTVLLTANGMSDQVGYTALAAKALTSTLSDPQSLVHRLTDPRWLTLAKTYNFAGNGLAAIKNPAAIAKIAQDYAKATWMKSEDTVSPGLSNALSFIQQASGITSVNGVLGNAAVRTVVTTALGIPQQIAFQTLEAQQNAISSHLDVKKFQDPKFVQSLAERYLIANRQNPSPAADTSLTSLSVQAGGVLA
jgi:hypothetical protein